MVRGRRDPGPLDDSPDLAPKKSGAPRHLAQGTRGRERGAAGRVRAWVAVRLCSEECPFFEYSSFRDLPPEITSLDLAQTHDLPRRLIQPEKFVKLIDQ